MSQLKDTVAERILDKLESQSFADWYNTDGQFDDYITGAYPKDDPKQPTKKQILDYIKKEFLKDMK